jgi:deoxyribodipyrimidine photo-lyase
MSPALLWFRHDLRLADNPALQALIDSGHTPLPVYIHNEPDTDWKTGAASNWWLHHSLVALQQSLQQHGSDLLVFQGNPEGILTRLLQQTGADRLAWNRCYEPAGINATHNSSRPLRNGDATSAAITPRCCASPGKT